MWRKADDDCSEAKGCTRPRKDSPFTKAISKGTSQKHGEQTGTRSDLRNHDGGVGRHRKFRLDFDQHELKA